MSDNDKKTEDQASHEGSMGTDRRPPSGTEEAKPLSNEEKLKRRIAELRKRDPFIYR
jgi:hypothetical protein